MATRGLRNNNPGNIRLSEVKYQGEIKGSDKAFKSFGSRAYGYRAMLVILRTYYNKYRLNTITKMIHRWAPTCENDTRAYINNVSKWSGIKPDAVIEITSKQMMCAIVAAMSRVENGVQASRAEVEAGWELL